MGKYTHITTLHYLSIESYVPKRSGSSVAKKKKKGHNPYCAIHSQTSSHPKCAVPFSFSPPEASSIWKQPILPPLEKELFHSPVTATFFPSPPPVPQVRFVPLPTQSPTKGSHSLLKLTARTELPPVFSCKQQSPNSRSHSHRNSKHLKRRTLLTHFFLTVK